MKNIFVPLFLCTLLLGCVPTPESIAEHDSYRNFIDSVNKTVDPNPQITKPTKSLAELEDSLVKEYKNTWDYISLEKLQGLPQYQSYFDTLNSIVNDINSITEQGGDKLPKLEKLRLKLINSEKYTEALSNYAIYGQLLYRDELQPVCETALESVLNDPSSLDVVAYNLKGQNKKGWVVTLRYHAKNSFGAKVLEKATFIVQYNIVDKVWNVVDLN